ncbi:fasciclin domain-containing protein [Streptomyces sp. C10-9-1]|uniref:fasciclin domain-containing protein n=1 Tax=Streptomyces sp. C10-9-1 TaxID=1859285 RepID=UPI003D71CF0E
MNTNLTRRGTVAAGVGTLLIPLALMLGTPAQADVRAEPVGPACASLPQEGEGSAEGMVDDPVATAASNNPELSTLTTAIEQAGLADTLNDAENITVFAPTDEAFEKVPQADLDALLADKDQLTEVLTYHVVGEEVAPGDLADGTFETLQGDDLTTDEVDGAYIVNDSAKVVCGDLETENATVHLVDTVLLPPESTSSPS